MTKRYYDLERTLYDEDDSPSVVQSLHPPKTIDPWIVDQLDKRARRSWAGRELDKKADKDWVLEKFSSLQRESDSTKSTIREYKSKLSAAPKRYEMDDLKGVLSGWSGWFRKSVVAFIIFIIGSLGTVGWNYSSLNSRVDSAYETVQDVKGSLEIIEDNQRAQEQKLELIQRLLEQVINPNTHMPL